MALDVYFREDIANILRSVNMAGSGRASIVNREIAKAAGKDGQLDAADLADRLDIYEQGYLDALGAIAAAFGIVGTQSSELVPDMLVAHSQQDDSLAQVITQSWNLKPKVPI
jgi:hypothetical protein